MSETPKKTLQAPMAARPDSVRPDLDRNWHLAETELEIHLAELEYSLMRTFEAFGRWQSECLASVLDVAASGPENALLHVIRMHDRAKNMKTLARLTNREDIPNMQYSLRKLIKAGLVERTGSGRSGVSYSVTTLGLEVTDRYAQIRRELLVSFLDGLPDVSAKLAGASRTLDLMSGIYEQAGRIVATHR